MAFDRMDWHYGGDYPEQLPNVNGGTHIGFYLTWLIHTGLIGEFHLEESIDELAAVCERKMNGREFLITMCDEKFTNEDVNEEGSKFTEFYFQAEDGGFFDDYERVLAQGLPSVYHVENTWENYDKIALVIDEVYNNWKNDRAC
ncbi:hypothetical protein [Providencia burhodogranariea]|uniref:DUF7832 domain-containing protein n=1 Tax=Providencia burhodogranariea DSM 19968 TaxID=1141662 RepID=K8WPX1_9GAMM|nr:hypothetical protein OOA_06516 [Providencia burhodogranariea DSM 19968]